MTIPELADTETLIGYTLMIFTFRDIIRGEDVANNFDHGHTQL